jgi:hypothetical protein
VITPEFRTSYVSVLSPRLGLNGEMEYSLVAIFPSTTDLSAMKAAAEALLITNLGADRKKWPPLMRNPFRKCAERWTVEDGKTKIPAGYEDGEAIFMTFKSSEKGGRPGVVDQNVQKIIEPSEFYSGCYALASVNAFFYNQKGNKGISFGLNNVQKTRDGEHLGGRASAESDFKPVVDPGRANAGNVVSIFD